LIPPHYLIKSVKVSVKDRTPTADYGRQWSILAFGQSRRHWAPAARKWSGSSVIVVVLGVQRSPSTASGNRLGFFWILCALNIIGRTLRADTRRPIAATQRPVTLW